MATLLTAHGIVKRFEGLVAVNGVDLEIEEHSIIGLIGPNGAGKTTLFNCLTGFTRPDAGEIRLGNVRLDGLPAHRIAALGVSRTFQNIRLFGAMTALENVLIGEHRLGKSSAVGAIFRPPWVAQEERRLAETAYQLLKFVLLSERANAIASSLAYGEQRRLEIARALGVQPRLLLLDEPTAGMNPQESLALVGLIRRIRDELGVTILLIEHQMRVVMGVCERITVLDYGEKIAEGPPEQIQRDANVVRAYLGSGYVTAQGPA